MINQYTGELPLKKLSYSLDYQHYKIQKAHQNSE